jgi:hypothetical protein
MKKNVSISYLSLLILLLTTAITIILLINIPTIVSYISDEGDNKINAILGVMGNISGGLVGGIVAYIVAAYQVSKSNEQTDLLNLKQAYINLRLLLDEIEYNDKVIKSGNSHQELTVKALHLQKQLSSEQWGRISPSFADVLTSEDFKNVCNLYRNIHFIKNNHESVSDPFINSNQVLIEKLLNRFNSILDEINQKIK